MMLETALALALTCPTLPITLAPIMVGIAQHENPSLDPNSVHHNANGTTDYGLAQVNTVNLKWTGLTNPFDPCANLTAASKVLFAHYNGNPPDNIKALYASGVMTRLSHQAPEAMVEPDGDAIALSGHHLVAPNPFTRPSRIGRDTVVLSAKTKD